MESTAIINAVLFGSMFLVLYFFFLRPQVKKAKAQEEFQSSTQKGDKIVTMGGIHGKIVSMRENTVQLEITPGTIIRIDRSAISTELTAQARAETPKGK